MNGQLQLMTTNHAFGYECSVHSVALVMRTTPLAITVIHNNINLN